MSTTRTDTHRPSQIIPDDYVFVACAYLKIENLGDALFLQEQRETLKAHMARTGGTYSRHEHGGNCHVCGSVNLIYSIVYYHEPSNSYIRVGEDCAQKLDMGGQREFSKFRAAVHDALAAKAGKAKAKALLEEARITEAWEIYEATERTGFAYEEDTITDIVGKLVKYGSVSVAQGEFVHRLLDKIHNRAHIEAQRKLEADAAAPCPTGRVTVTGTILSTRVQDSAFGSVTKMLVRDDSGFKVWCTSPNSGEQHGKGDRVCFTATVEPSRDDPKFGFGKRPAKLTVIQAAAPAVA